MQITISKPEEISEPVVVTSEEPIQKFRGQAVLIDIGEDGHPNLAKACIPDGTKYGQPRYFTFSGEPPVALNKEFDVEIELFPWTRLVAKRVAPAGTLSES